MARLRRVGLWEVLRHRVTRPSEGVALAASIAFLIVGTGWSILDDGRQIKVASAILIAIVLSSLVLTLRAMVVNLIVMAGCLIVTLIRNGFNSSQLSASGFVVIGIASVVALVQARRRDRLGLRDISAEGVLGLIRDRLLVQAQLPEVPDGWLVDVQQRPADGAAIAGDFVTTRLTHDAVGDMLHLVVVDVSGSGIAAGPRALLLSGAMGGLLGSVPPEQFLPAANGYLGRQEWAIGFASAVYVCLELTSGRYTVRVAGHPPVLHFQPSAQPRWRTSAATGTVLGVLSDMTGLPEEGVLQPGDALLLYTDGVVEDRTRDLDSGIQRLKEAAEAQAASGDWTTVAGSLIDTVPRQRDDDRTVVLLRRQADVDAPLRQDETVRRSGASGSV